MSRAVVVILWVLVPSLAAPDTSQPLLGARATGLAGAFTAVADDASAFHWNPAGLVYGAFVRGAFFGGGAFRDQNQLIHRLRAESLPGGGVLESDRAVGFSTELTVLGVAFTRFTHTRSFLEEEILRSEALETSDLALSFVRSLPVDELTVGVNLHFVWGEGFEQRELATSVPPDERNVSDVIRRSTRGEGFEEFEPNVDLGVLYRPRGWVSLGLTLRNLTRPTFHTASELPLELERHGRLGVALYPSESSLLTFDVDVSDRELPASDDDFRELALGVEKRWAAGRFALRGGMRLEAGAGETRPGYAAGLSARIKWMCFEAAMMTGTRRRQGALWFALTVER